MWIVAVIFFAIVAICAVGSVWESRKRRVIYRGTYSGAPIDTGSAGYSGSTYGYGSYGDAGGSSGDCGGGGGGFGGGGGGDGGGSC